MFQNCFWSGLLKLLIISSLNVIFSISASWSANSSYLAKNMWTLCKLALAMSWTSCCSSWTFSNSESWGVLEIPEFSLLRKIYLTLSELNRVQWYSVEVKKYIDFNRKLIEITKNLELCVFRGFCLRPGRNPGNNA